MGFPPSGPLSFALYDVSPNCMYVCVLGLFKHSRSLSLLFAVVELASKPFQLSFSRIVFSIISIRLTVVWRGRNNWEGEGSWCGGGGGLICGIDR